MTAYTIALAFQDAERDFIETFGEDPFPEDEVMYVTNVNSNPFDFSGDDGHEVDRQLDKDDYEDYSDEDDYDEDYEEYEDYDDEDDYDYDEDDDA